MIDSTDLPPGAASPIGAPSPEEKLCLGRELGELLGGQTALENAPWYPGRAGDILHVHHEEIDRVAPARGETYIVERSEVGLVLRLLHHDATVWVPGAYAPGMIGEPMVQPWFEVGPQRMTIVRAGRVVHDGPGRQVRVDGATTANVLLRAAIILEGGRYEEGIGHELGVTAVIYAAAAELATEDVPFSALAETSVTFLAKWLRYADSPVRSLIRWTRMRSWHGIVAELQVAAAKARR